MNAGQGELNRENLGLTPAPASSKKSHRSQLHLSQGANRPKASCQTNVAELLRKDRLRRERSEAK
jgi:hypothetical protein